MVEDTTPLEISSIATEFVEITRQDIFEIQLTLEVSNILSEVLVPYWDDANNQ